MFRKNEKIRVTFSDGEKRFYQIVGINLALELYKVLQLSGPEGYILNPEEYGFHMQHALFNPTRYTMESL